MKLTSNGRFGLSGYQPRQEPGTRREYSATVPRSLIQCDVIRIMDDQHSDLPASVCLVQHVGDTHPLKLLAVDPISYCNPCNQCRGRTQRFKVSTLSSLRPNPLARRPSMAGVNTVV